MTNLSESRFDVNIKKWSNVIKNSKSCRSIFTRIRFKRFVKINRVVYQNLRAKNLQENKNWKKKKQSIFFICIVWVFHWKMDDL